MPLSLGFLKRPCDLLRGIRSRPAQRSSNTTTAMIGEKHSEGHLQLLTKMSGYPSRSPTTCRYGESRLGGMEYHLGGSEPQPACRGEFLRMSWTIVVGLHSRTRGSGPCKLDLAEQGVPNDVRSAGPSAHPQRSEVKMTPPRKRRRSESCAPRLCGHASPQDPAPRRTWQFQAREAYWEVFGTSRFVHSGRFMTHESKSSAHHA